MHTSQQSDWSPGCDQSVTNLERLKTDPTVSIIIPTLNEVENIVPLVSQIAATSIPFREIIFVDGHSADGTRDVIQSLTLTYPIRLIDQNGAKPGLAAAIMMGANAAKGDLLIVMDGDLSHPPGKMSELLGPLKAGTADLVIGSRYVCGASTPDWSYRRRILSRLGSALAYPLTGVRDSMCGFFAMSRLQLLALAAPAVGFKIAFEVMVEGRGTLRIIEVPIAFRDRIHGKSKLSFGVALQFFLRWLLALWRRITHSSSRKRS
jgi:dolichol-phosphate mannosyltransferase